MYNSQTDTIILLRFPQHAAPTSKQLAGLRSFI